MSKVQNTPTNAYEGLHGTAAENYERLFVPRLAGPLAHDLVALAEIRRGEHVADIACGTGAVTRLVPERVGTETGVTAVDITPEMLEVARSVVGNAAVTWHEALAESLPLADSSFDVALCQLGLQFFGDREGSLREMLRILRPGGRLVLNVPGSAHPVFVAMEDGLTRHLSPEAGSFVGLVFSLQNPDELRRLFAGAGFDDVSVTVRTKRVSLGPPTEFLWAYLSCTPLAGPIDELEDGRRTQLEQDVVPQWTEWEENGELAIDLEMIDATALKPNRGQGGAA